MVEGKNVADEAMRLDGSGSSDRNAKRSNSLPCSENDQANGSIGAGEATASPPHEQKRPSNSRRAWNSKSIRAKTSPNLKTKVTSGGDLQKARGRDSVLPPNPEGIKQPSSMNRTSTYCNCSILLYIASFVEG